MRRLVPSFLVLASLLEADFHSWRYRKPVDSPAADKICTVRLDREIYAGSRPDLADLRVGRNGEEVAHVLEPLAAQRVIAEGVPRRSEDPQVRMTSLVFDLGAAGLPHDRVQLQSDAPFHFYRETEIDAGPDGEQWTYVAHGAIYCLPGEESLTLSYPEQHARYVRLRISNGSDRPVPVSAAQFKSRERRVRFLPGASGTFWIYYGNPDAERPVYDLPHILERRRDGEDALLAAGPQQPNPRYAPPAGRTQPWTERHPQLLYSVLAAAIAGLGYITFRLLRTVRGGRGRVDDG
jgi:hypothetical protein